MKLPGGTRAPPGSCGSSFLHLPGRMDALPRDPISWKECSSSRALTSQGSTSCVTVDCVTSTATQTQNHPLHEDNPALPRGATSSPPPPRPLTPVGRWFKVTLGEACDGAGLHPLTSPRYKFNFIADVVEKIAPAVVHIELFLRRPKPRPEIASKLEAPLRLTRAPDPRVEPVSVQRLTPGCPSLGALRQVIEEITTSCPRLPWDHLSLPLFSPSPQKKLPVLLLGHSADLRPGEFVVAIGSPFALQNTVTTGIVSTAQRDGRELGLRDSDMDYVQTDAIINYGNSGGPLVNLDGEVIGINTLKVAAGISFAIPSDRITRFLSEFQDKHIKGWKKRFIGIRMRTITPSLVEELKAGDPDFPSVSSGIYVQEVVPNSPSQRGGIQDGDIIVKVNGRPLVDSSELQEAIMKESPLLLEVQRGNDDLLFSIVPEVVV
ncbi:HtrA serine peptidase 3 [Ictidomys tridecemlineatus]|nr:HtrA serine peptidase 3 [Ictidomys tridecemlineatus]